MLAENNIVGDTKSNRHVNEKKDEKRALKGSKKLWVNKSITTLSIELISNIIYEYG
jgi:hypothetical protein